MTDLRAVLSPQLEEHLRELAADRRSTLLRVPRHSPARSPLDRPVSARSLGLTKLERHLLQHYRSELAFLLRQACILRLYEFDTTASRMIRQIDPKQTITFPSAEDWQSSADVLLRQASLEADVRATAASVHELVARGIASLPTTQLAAAAARIEPSHAVRIHHALGLAGEGQAASALRELEGVLQERPDHKIASLAWTNIGLLCSQADDLQGSMQAYANASKAWPEYVSAVASWFVQATLCGAEPAARVAGRHLNDLVVQDHAGITEEVALHSRLRSSGLLSPSQPGIDLARRMTDALAGAAGRIANALV